MMNVHHLELFYYVAKHRGISEAVRHIPYGIQQPAVSGQMIQLEDFLGVTLFQRRPFALTPAGTELYAFIEPFFSNLSSVAQKLSGGVSQHLRIGASQAVLRDHLPEILQAVRRRFPNLKITLREGYQADLQNALQKQEVDLVITLLSSKPAPGMQSLELLNLPLVLLVPSASPWKKAEALWKQDRITEPLICLPAHEPICRAFQQKLREMEIDWFPQIEVSSLELIETYVANGHGIGLSFGIPKNSSSSKIRVLPLDGFPAFMIGVSWNGKPGPVMQCLLDELKRAGERIKAEG